MDENRNLFLGDSFAKYNSDGAVVCKMQNHSVLNEAQKTIETEFTETAEHYSKMSREDFSDFALKVQGKVNEIGIQRRFIESEKRLLSQLLKSDNICYQSICFLRAVRPESFTGIIEAPDFHRETFYSDDPATTEKMLNIWIPIKNVVESNTLQYLPGSHLIPDNCLSVTPDNSLVSVEKFSSAHKLGFFWSQKKIGGGVDINDAQKAEFEGVLGEYLAFSSMTIHGGARNLHNEVRFVVGFGLIAEEDINSNKDYFPSGKKYFLKF